MNDNPFDDPAVQQGANAGPPPVPSNVYGNDNAYDDAAPAAPAQVNVDMAMQAASYIPAEQQKQLAVSAGSAVANQAMNQVANDYEEQAKTQQDHNEAPPPPPFCLKLMAWFPIRMAALIGGGLLVICPILDLIFSSPKFIQAFIFIYLIGFGVVALGSEALPLKAFRKMQLGIFFWFRLMSRMWGRAWFYLFVSILCFAGVNDGAAFTVAAGVYLFILALLSFVFSRMAAKKFARLREFIAAGAEGDEMKRRFMAKFDELDRGGKAEPSIDSTDIVTVMRQAGREISNSERHAIQTFLDESCKGHVTKEDWMNMLVHQYEKNGFKQRFL